MMRIDIFVLLQINLSTEGYEVITASNGLDAIDILTTTPIDLVLMDIVMPKMDGISTCERIRQFSNVPVIMLTGRNAEEDKVRCLNIGADDYITKPFSATEVLARVRAVLRRTRSNRDDSNHNVFNNDYLKWIMPGQRSGATINLWRSLQQNINY